MFTLLLAITMEEMGVGGVAAPAGSQIGEFSFAFEGQKSLMAMPFLVIDMEGDTLISYHLDAI